MARDQANELELLTASVTGRGGDEPPKRADQFLAKRQRRVAYGLLGPGAIYLALAFIVPLFLVVYTSLESGGLLSGGYSFTWAFDNYSEAFTQYRGFYAKSLVYSGLATLLCILLAYPMAYWIAFYAGKWKTTLFFLILVPFFVSFVIRTVQWKFLLADDGLIFGPLKSIGLLPDSFQVLATPIAVVAGITYNFLPFTFLPLYVALERIDTRLIEAAKDLYASRFQAFRKVVLPLSFPGLFAALDPHVRAGDGRLRELERARLERDDDDRPNHPDQVPHRGRLPRGGGAVRDPHGRDARHRGGLRQGARHRGLDAGGGRRMSVATVDKAPVTDRPPIRVKRKRWTSYILPVFTVAMIAYLASPIFVMIVFSFNVLKGQERQVAHFTCCTLDWWQDLFGSKG